MSILPTQQQQKNRLTSTTSLQNPNNINNDTINHGSFEHQHQQQHHRGGEEDSTAHPILHSQPCSVATNNFSGSLPPPADDSRRSSSNKVNKQLWRPRAETSTTTTTSFGAAHQNAHHTSSLPQGNSSRVTPASTSAAAQGTTRHSAAAARKSQMVSGNHLLNFQYDHPISRAQPRGRGRAPPPPRRHPKRKPYNKDLFLQANYKFVVLDTGDYTPETMDPDKMLRWEDILCFKYLSPFPVRCPICLGDPLCPQITSCGHIFCFPCIMQYFLMDQDDHKRECWKKCPLCFTMMSSLDLYTIKIETVKQHSVGDTIEFILLSRKKDSYTLSLKNEDGDSTNEGVLDFFSKFTLTSDVELSVREAMSDLDSWLARADAGLVDDLEKLPYVCAAMEQLEKRRKYWNEHRVSDRNKARHSHSTSFGSPPTVKAAKELVRRSHSPQSNDKSPLLGKSPPEKVNAKSHVVQTAADQQEEHDESSSSSHDDNINTRTDGLKDGIDRDSYNFYQAIDGQLIIIHSINMKCLLHHYGTSDRLPNRISGKILQLETVTQSETTRKRFRYLSHFSLTTTFQLCEIDLREVLPADALAPYMDEIKNREKQRKQLARKEQQEKIKAEAVGLDLVPIPYNVAQSSFDESPTFSMDDFEALGSSNVTASSSTTTSPAAFGARQLFSSVTRLGFAAGYDSPTLNTAEEPQSLPQINGSGGMNGGGGSSRSSFANITSSTAKPEEDKNKSKNNESGGKKGKKPSRVLLSTAGGRRY